MALAHRNNISQIERSPQLDSLFRLQTVFFFCYIVRANGANTIFIVNGLTRMGIESTIWDNKVEGINNYYTVIIRL